MATKRQILCRTCSQQAHWPEPEETWASQKGYDDLNKWEAMWIRSLGKKVKEDESERDLPTEKQLTGPYITSGPLRFWKRQNTEVKEILSPQTDLSVQKITGILEIPMKRQRSIHCFGQAPHELSPGRTPPCGSRCKRLREQGNVQLQIEVKAFQVNGNLIPVPTYPAAGIIYLIT